ncbi:MAG: hypothetical protein M3Y87_18400 [Myxococcota bacterium]|nr:hypothetical protein [Myxococcota bacterium]
MPTPSRDPDSIRPGVLVAAAGFLGVVALLAWGVVSSVSTTGGSASIEGDGERGAGGRRVVLLGDDDGQDEQERPVRDPGAQGSVRERWASADPLVREPLPPMVEALVDPQLRTFHAMWGDGTPPPFEPIEQRARIVSARGLALDPNASCDVRVLPVRDSGFNCLVRVVCGDTVVYPNPSQTAGYLSCAIDASGGVAGTDTGPTSADGDPAIRLDPATGRVQISNLDWNGPGSAFDVEIAVDPTSLRTGV